MEHSCCKLSTCIGTESGHAYVRPSLAINFGTRVTEEQREEVQHFRDAAIVEQDVRLPRNREKPLLSCVQSTDSGFRFPLLDCCEHVLCAFLRAIKRTAVHNRLTTDLRWLIPENGGLYLIRSRSRAEVGRWPSPPKGSFVSDLQQPCLDKCPPKFSFLVRCRTLVLICFTFGKYRYTFCCHAPFAGADLKPKYRIHIRLSRQ